MKTNKLIAILLAALMLLALCACGSSSGSGGASSGTAGAGTQTGTADASYKVGVVQLVQHPALDAATQGFQDALKEKLGDKVSFDVQNASGDSGNCSVIVNGFVSDNVDLIMANATPALQAAASATSTIPVLGTSITDYASALELQNWTGTVGGNISGTSDLAPLDQQAAMVKELFPDAQKVGLLYCSGEANSVYQCQVIEGELTGLGYEVKWFAFTDSNDLSAVAESACDYADVIYIPTDNTAANNTEAIANVLLPKGVPAVVGEEGLCKGCGVATLSISYYDLGYATGLMAADVLTGAKNISEMPVQYAPNAVKEYQAANAEALGVTIPSDYTAVAMD